MKLIDTISSYHILLKAFNGTTQMSYTQRPLGTKIATVGLNFTIIRHLRSLGNKYSIYIFCIIVE